MHPQLYVDCHEVISRYVLDVPTDWAHELTCMPYGSFLMPEPGFTILESEHVRTDINYSNRPYRRRGTIDAILHVAAFFPGMIFFFLIGLEEALRALVTTERSDMTPWMLSLVPFMGIIYTAGGRAAALSGHIGADQERLCDG